MMYDVANWYWSVVGGDATKVFSSASASYVPTSDATYLAWIAAGGTTTRINSAEELYEVLLNQWLPGRMAAGINLTSTGTPALDGPYPLDDQSQQYINAVSTGIAAGKGLPGGGSTFMFDGRSFNATQFLNFASACENYAYQFVQDLGLIINTGSGALPSPNLTIA